MLSSFQKKKKTLFQKSLGKGITHLSLEGITDVIVFLASTIWQYDGPS